MNLLQNELNRDVACFTIDKKNTLQPYLLQHRFKLACVADVPYGRGDDDDDDELYSCVDVFS